MCDKNKNIMKEQPKEQPHELSDDMIEAVSGGANNPALEAVKKREEVTKNYEEKVRQAEEAKKKAQGGG